MTLIRQTVLYLPAQLLGPLVQLAGIIIWTHWFQPDEFGLFTLVLAAQEAMYLLFLFAWSQFLLRFLPGADADLRRRMNVLEAWAGVTGACCQMVTLAVVLRLAFDRWPQPGLLLTLFLYSLTRAYCTHLGERAKAEGAIGVYTVLQTMGPVLGLLLGLLWTRVEPTGPQQVLMAYTAAQALSLIIVMPRLSLRARLQAADKSLLIHVCAYGLPLAISGTLAWVPTNGIRFLVEHSLGITAVGLFSVGWALGQRACAFTAMLVTAAAFPIALRLQAEGKPAQALQQLSMNGALLCMVMLPTAMGVIELSTPMAQTLVSQAYVPATVGILPIATFAALVKNLRSHFANQPFLLAQKTGWTLAIDVLETTLFFVGVMAGLHWLGLTGAAWGVLAASLISAIAAFAIAIFRLGMPVPSAHLLKIVVATAVMGTALHFLPPFSGWLRLTAAIAFGAAIYVALLAVFYRHRLGDLRKALNPTF